MIFRGKKAEFTFFVMYFGTDYSPQAGITFLFFKGFDSEVSETFSKTLSRKAKRRKQDIVTSKKPASAVRSDNNHRTAREGRSAGC